MKDDAQSDDRPLAGIRVIELGNFIAAPFASRLLAEFGADVIKIEPPGAGDPLRNWRAMHNGTSLWWYVQSRNKRSVSLNLKAPEAQEIVRTLAAEADVVIENFRPGMLERWNVGWDALSAINPRLVMVRISGYGQTGPYRDRPGFGAIGEALGGIRYTTGSPDRPPSRAGVSLGDSLASLHAVIGALMCLLQVTAGRGQGQVVDVSLVESVFSVMEGLVPEYDLLGRVRERSGGTLPGIIPSNSYLSADGDWVVIAGNSDSIFRRLMEAIGRSDLAHDLRLQTNAGRAEHEKLIDDALADWAGRHTLTDILAVLGRAEVPSAPIYSAADIVRDPHFVAREMIVPSRLPDGTEVKMPGVVPKLSRTPGRVDWLGPALGEHTEAVLADLGFSGADLMRLRKSGVI